MDKRWLVGGLLLLWVQPAGAEEEAQQWFLTGALQASAGDYYDSAQRNDYNSAGVVVHLDYLERAGITFGYNRTNVDFKANTKDMEQDAFFASGRVNLTPDGIPGHIGLRLDGHWLDNDDTTNLSDEVDVFAPMISYASYDKQWYFDLGYAYSDYGDSIGPPGRRQSLHVSQLTPTVGFGFNEMADWLQIRGYFIDPSNSARADGENDTQAVEAKWTHWFEPSTDMWMPYTTAVTGMAGERIFAVDPDTASVYNLADVHRGALSLATTWRLNDDRSVILSAGHDWYEDQDNNDEYGAASLYLNFTQEW